MTRSRAAGKGRSLRGNATLEGEKKGSAIEATRSGDKPASSIPSTRSRRTRGRGGLPLTSKNKDVVAQELDHSPSKNNDSNTSNIHDSQDQQATHNANRADETLTRSSDDKMEVSSPEMKDGAEVLGEIDPHETSSHSSTDSKETNHTLEAQVRGKTVLVVVKFSENETENSLSVTTRPRRAHAGRSSPRNGAATSRASGDVVPLGHDGNLFYCHVCKGFGDVVCCDGCPRVYHITCIPLDDPSRQSLDNDDSPWYCPECTNKDGGTPRQSRRMRSNSHERRALKRKCIECQEAGGERPMEPCEGCGAYMHHPSCGDSDLAIPLCSNCRVEQVVADEETENLGSARKKRKIDNQHALSSGDEENHDEEQAGISRRKRSRSMDTISDHANDEVGSEDEEVSDDSFNLGRKEWPSSEKKNGKRTRRPTLKHDLFGESPGKRKRGRPRLTPQQKEQRAEGRNKYKLAEQQKHKLKLKRKKKKRKRQMEAADKGRGSPAGPSPTEELAPPRRAYHGPVTATPGFFFFLSDNRPRIERVLSRKKPLFNRLPKGIERTQLIAREGAIWWVRARPAEQRRYLNMSMHDFEEQVIAWKEEKSIREMIMSRESDSETNERGDLDGEDAAGDRAPEDELITYNNHKRLYLATSVGSKPFIPEPGKSNNRVLLELLQDIRFHPLPMFNPCRTELEFGQNDYSKMTIPYFDVHGPVSTSVGDECLGCTRGWNHFCPVLQRRIPAVEHRAKLQPPLSSLMATRIGLGLRDHVLEVDQQSQNPYATPNTELFSVRETQDALVAKSIPQIPSFFMTHPSSRADDIVQFIEEAVAMKIPEPPRPNSPATTRSDPVKKSMLSRGALPTRGRKKNLDSSDTGSSGETGEDGKPSGIKKCGRCRTIIDGDTGCTQCRRAQLVINMSKRQPVSAHSKPGKRDFNAAGLGSGFLKVQTAMVGRYSLKESNFDRQSEGDRAVSNAIIGMRWSPNSVLPPRPILVPTFKPCPEKDAESDLDECSESDEEDSSLSEPEAFAGEQVKEVSENKESKPDEQEKPASVTSENESSSSAEEEKPVLRTIPTRGARQRASARLEAASSERGGIEKREEEDRQEMAETHKEEADALHRRCLSVACSSILLAMMRRDPLWLFAEPVPSSVVGYSKIVKDPIDFGKIRLKVLAGKYSSFGAFVSDARRLCTNALAFNPPGSIYSKTAQELHDVLEVMQKRATNWIGAIRDAHASSFAWRRIPSKGENDGGDIMQQHDPFKELRKTWPEAVEHLENGDWARQQIDADFMRTKENEIAYYGNLAIRRAALAGGASLAQYFDKGGAYNPVVRRSHVDDEALRRQIDDQVGKLTNPVQLKEMPNWREEVIIRMLRRVQNRRLEGRVASENGCARCDSIRMESEAKMSMKGDAIRWGRNKKKGEVDTLPRIHDSRLSLSTGLASSKARELAEKEKTETSNSSGMRANKSLENVGKVSDVSVSVRGSRIHGWGLFAERPFKRGEVVAEYIGEYIRNPVADAREKMYQDQRIQDYQFRVDENLVIDATLRGGHGRYINHNCTPNCVAKIVDGLPPDKHLKRVLIISQQDIAEREEISYDYQFPLELDLDQRIPCNCGSMQCRGFMNWDLPEKGSKNRVMRTQKRGGNMRDRIRRLGRPLKR